MMSKFVKFLCVAAAIALMAALLTIGLEMEKALTNPEEDNPWKPPFWWIAEQFTEPEQETEPSEPPTEEPTEPAPVVPTPRPTRPPETEPEETEPMETEPMETEPMETEPIETRPEENWDTEDF